MNKPLGITAVVLAVLAAIFMYGRIQRAIGAEDVQAGIAATVALERKVTLDSVRRANDAKEKEGQRAADSAKHAQDLKLQNVRRTSDTAIANARAAAEDARKILADSAATVLQLRGSLHNALDAIDTLTQTITRERAAADWTLKQRDATHAGQLANLRANHADERTAAKAALAAQLKSAEAQVRASYRKGVAMGRMQTIGGLGVAAVVTLFVLR